MGLLDTAEDFLWRRALGKGVRVVVQAAVSYLLAHAELLKSWGVTVAVDPDALMVLLMGGAEVARNWIKQRVLKKS